MFSRTTLDLHSRLHRHVFLLVPSQKLREYERKCNTSKKAKSCCKRAGPNKRETDCRTATHTRTGNEMKMFSLVSSFDFPMYNLAGRCRCLLMRLRGQRAETLMYRIDYIFGNIAGTDMQTSQQALLANVTVIDTQNGVCSCNFMTTQRDHDITGAHTHS